MMMARLGGASSRSMLCRSMINARAAHVGGGGGGGGGAGPERAGATAARAAAGTVWRSAAEVEGLVRRIECRLDISLDETSIYASPTPSGAGPGADAPGATAAQQHGRRRRVRQQMFHSSFSRLRPEATPSVAAHAGASGPGGGGADGRGGSGSGGSGGNGAADGRRVSIDNLFVNTRAPPPPPAAAPEAAAAAPRDASDDSQLSKYSGAIDAGDVGAPADARANPIVVIISGPSGVGKDAVVQLLQDRRRELKFVVTATTRAKRDGEVDGVDYFFVSKGDFESMLERDELLEHAVVYGDYKGIPKQQVRDLLRAGDDVVLRLDVQGAATVRGLIPDAVSIFITAESDRALVSRLISRKTEDEDTLTLRVETARKEFLRISEFDYVVVNEEGKLSEAVDAIAYIVDMEKMWRRSYEAL